MEKSVNQNQSGATEKPNDLALAPAAPSAENKESEKAGCQQRLVLPIFSSPEDAYYGAGRGDWLKGHRKLTNPVSE